MKWILVFLGGYIVVVGALLCAFPPIGKRMLDVFMQDKVSRRWAVVTTSIGALIVWAAQASRAGALIQLLGVIAVLKGIYLLLAPRAQLLGILDWWNRLSDGSRRLWGVMSMVLGAAMLMSL